MPVLQVVAEAAALVAQSGAEVVDINLGCPVRRVVSKGAGAALLQEPARLRQLLNRVRIGAWSFDKFEKAISMNIPLGLFIIMLLI